MKLDSFTQWCEWWWRLAVGGLLAHIALAIHAPDGADPAFAALMIGMALAALVAPVVYKGSELVQELRGKRTTGPRGEKA